MEKERKSAEIERAPQTPVLPTVNPDAEKPAPPKPSLHPAFYITYVSELQ